MRRPGRQNGTEHLGAEIDNLVLPRRFSLARARTASLSAQAALAAASEAWEEARLDQLDPERIGLIVGGSNVQQRELLRAQDAVADRPRFLRPTYALAFLDTDLCGICTAELNIRGISYSVGAASASGQLAIIRAIEAVQSGDVDACIAVGALMDLSHWECQSLRTLGAMGSDRFANEPGEACRPFDRNRDGFIYGEACGAVVIENIRHGARTGTAPYARVSGWGVAVDANRNPNPSLEGEMRAIRLALRRARLAARDVDYINPHGTGSVIGDEIELEALRRSGLAHAWINSTKSIIGHGITAAGTVEVVATLIQMRKKALHPSVNLVDPIDPSFNWVRSRSISHAITNAVTLSMGFGGINTALCLESHH
jgi:malonyl-ACP decarboxylase